MKFLVQNIDKMQNVVDKFLKDNNIDVKANIILANRNPRACWYRNISPTGKDIFFIEFNDSNWISFNQGNNAESILNTLIHECLHHLAYHRKLKFNDGDYDFEKLLFEYGADSNYEDTDLEDIDNRFLDFELYNRRENFIKTKNKYLKLLL